MRIGFVGGGNMAQALIGGVAAKDAEASFVVVEPDDAARRSVLALAPDAIVVPAAGAELADCDAVVVAVKPQQCREAVDAAARWLARPVVVSIAAGIRTADLLRWLGSGERRVVRAMPNTPALIGAGISGLYAHATVDADGRNTAERLLAAVGETVWVDDESLLDAVTAVSGSGPAYVFAFIEDLQRAAETLGLGSESARRLAVATVVGSGALAARSAEPASLLRERVTSKGGTTAAALAHLDESGWHDALVDAVGKAAARAARMGDEFGRDP